MHSKCNNMKVHLSSKCTVLRLPVMALHFRLFFMCNILFDVRSIVALHCSDIVKGLRIHCPRNSQKNERDQFKWTLPPNPTYDTFSSVSLMDGTRIQSDFFSAYVNTHNTHAKRSNKIDASHISFVCLVVFVTVFFCFCRCYRVVCDDPSPCALQRSRRIYAY